MCCQLVDWMFSKWSVLLMSRLSRSSLKMTMGSRMNRCAKCVASLSSMPPSRSFCLMDSSMTRSGSKYSGRRRESVEIYVEFDAYRDLGMRQRSFCRGLRSQLGSVQDVAGVREVKTYLLAQLLRCPVIDGPADLVPTDVCVCQEALINGGCCCQGQQDGPKRT